MHRLIIKKLGPIEECEVECSQFMTLTGFQASGKSTIAKAIYYFRTIKDDIINLAKRQAFKAIPVSGLETEFDVAYGNTLMKGLENYLREKFLRTFGSSWGMSNEMYIEYHFTDTCFVKVSLKEDTKFSAPNYIWITFSKDLLKILREKDNCFTVTSLGVPEEDIKKLKTELCEIFDDSCSVVYIPAGRSMITLLSQQLGYIYATMDGVQKRALDCCTKDYLERILRVKSEFSEGLQGLMAYYRNKTNLPPQIVQQALLLIKKILRGTYRYSNGEEQIILEKGKYVKINFSSSGQQECVWILNLLFYYLLQQMPILFIIEEPESHLFPESQKYITELIALVSNCKHSVVLTTHSPYVLGTLNNLLYAHTIPSRYVKEVDEIIPMSIWLNDKKFASWFVKNGTVENCMDAEAHMIQNEKIDEISKVINAEFDEILNLQETDEEGVN
ncbi:MAG: ATP-binding protein [Lachnoclostridium sp.]|nr:ATP-binding protein [Lachnospiraceae bacterium]MCM1249484.1 ATP-binding protein [Lachnoclostridium sp.]MCM1536520.1 ATP-binding protein [Clostridium sp.]